MYEKFIKAINDKKLVAIKFDSKEKGIIERTCVPFDFGASSRSKDKSNRYHFYDLDSPNGKHNLSILQYQLINIEIVNEEFKPKDYVTWNPIKWLVKRDWGQFS